MRRALYLGGIFLATGAAVALAAPAQAGGYPCADDYFVASCESGHGDVYSYYSDESINQYGVLNIGAIDLL
ncbi:hypothetical protein [Actinoplanes xinjiangensis]|jgi:hypothetical protein|uniref:Peptidase inhibitor family I36 n=1 Tax=Actinoplanes xinjiangensis TaxID=512350 RepID=A0A316FUV5_9ACTN|nr:hypothetical protein [Actinoplanes xinjiangensis]PWK52389.1 hypothetical protein BC793_101398 [Actinoplanes xinjiangensis]GIF36911.1 hypothetical protein Axi01nite_12220 [Actinoplanes xinjiangensis]